MDNSNHNPLYLDSNQELNKLFAFASYRIYYNYLLFPIVLPDIINSIQNKMAPIDKTLFPLVPI